MKTHAFPPFLIALLSLSASEYTCRSQILNPANNHYYYLIGPLTWTAAQAEAVALGGNLVTINDAAEDQWVYNTFGGIGRQLWIGFTDQASEGIFTWISGEPITYTNWYPGEPNNNGGNEDYAYIAGPNSIYGLTPGQWNDLEDNGPEFGQMYGVAEVVEVVPEPSTPCLLVLGGVFLTWLRNRGVPPHHPR